MGEWLLIHMVAVLACARMTRLFTADKITASMRARLELLTAGNSPPYGWVLLRELVTCPWCIGYWIGLAGSASALTVQPLPGVDSWIVLVPLSLAYSLLLVPVLGISERAASPGRG